MHSAMISVLVHSRGDVSALARTLSSLVPAVIDGIVLDAAILADEEDESCAEIADAAGCAYAVGVSVRDIAERVRGGWFLLLEEGAEPQAGWGEAAMSFALNAEGLARFRSGRRGWRGLFRPERALSTGLLLPRDRLLPIAERAATLEDIPRGRAAKTLDARIGR